MGCRSVKTLLHNSGFSYLIFSYSGSGPSETAGVHQHTHTWLFPSCDCKEGEETDSSGNSLGFSSVTAVRLLFFFFFFSTSALRQKHSESRKRPLQSTLSLPGWCRITLHSVHSAPSLPPDCSLHLLVSPPPQSGQ